MRPASRECGQLAGKEKKRRREKKRVEGKLVSIYTNCQFIV